jgi:hypothetical protein
MAAFRTSSTAIGVLALLACTASEAPAQWIFAGPGSTVQGDILRGEGVALQGAGVFNLYTAQANSINTDTWIRFNDYLYFSLELDRQKKAAHRLARLARDVKNYDEIMSRIANNPNGLDLTKGDALNEMRRQILDPRIPPSALRFSSVVLPNETIRMIPFQFSKKNATFSMERMLARNEWPVALRGAEFARERRAYDLAIDEALELAIEGKTTVNAVEAMRLAVSDLLVRLDEVIPKTDAQLYNPARNFLLNMRDRVVPLFAISQVEKALGALERYHGTTVGDLLMFMHDYDLQFGVAEGETERDLYKHLYASLIQQRDKLTMPEQPPKQ